MARFSVKKKNPKDNGWTEALASRAKQLDPDFDPLDVSHSEFVNALVQHHLNEVKNAHLPPEQ